MKRSDYQLTYQDLALTQDQKTRIEDYLDTALHSCGQRDGIAIYYVDAVNSLFRFISGDMESHDEFDDEFNLTTPTIDDGLVDDVLDEFDRMHLNFSGIFKARGESYREVLTETLNDQQKKLYKAAIVSHFRYHLYHVNLSLIKRGRHITLSNHAYKLAKLSFIRSLGITMSDLKASCSSSQPDTNNILQVFQ